MSIQSALNTALTSLNVLSQQTSVISNNIANANTNGYVQEDLPQSALVYGGVGAGVTAGQVQRLADESAAASANQANSASAYSQQMVSVLTNYTNVLGQATDSSSLPSVLSAFDTALTTLSNTPGDATAQSQAVAAAQTVASTFNGLSSAIQTAREQADQGIASGVNDVNSILGQLSQNQAAMLSASAQGQSTASYQNAQDKLLSQLSNDLPIKVTPDGSSGIMVSTDEGTTLLDGTTTYNLSFTPTPDIPNSMQVTADPSTGMTSGLSQVTVNGQPIQMSDSGSIAANLQLRDVTLPAFANQLDQTASNLIIAFQQEDPTTATSGGASLFTVANGAALTPGDPAQVTGVAGSIEVNPAFVSSEGGQSWKISAGGQATAPGGASDNTTVLAYIGALSKSESYDTSSGLPASMSVLDASTQLAGLQQSALTNWTSTNTNNTSQAQAAQTALSNATGVSVDDQMQRLLIVQQTYAASAQVIETASSMLNSFLTTIQQ